MEIFNKIYNLLANSSFIKRVLILLAIICSILQFIFFIPKIYCRTDPWRDVAAYYLVKERVHTGEPIYTESVTPGPHNRSRPLYLYPPVFTSILATLPRMSFATFARFWTILLYGSFWIYALALGKLAAGRFNFAGTLTASLFLFIFPGTFRAIELGQVDPLLWTFFSLALSFPFGRGFFLMAIGVIKPWGIWPLFWSWEGGYRIFLGAGLVLTGSVLVGILTWGGLEFLETCHIWFTDVLPTIAQGAWSPDNRSLSFGVLRLVRYSGLWSYHNGELPLWAKNWLLMCSLAGPFLAGWYLRKNSKNLQLAGIACAAILFSPICWTTYLPLLLTPMAVLFHEKSDKEV